jgi:hypothetical protein
LPGSLLITADTVAVFISIAIAALASYRAFTSRRVLASPLYRSRALWTGSVALITILFDVLAIVIENSGPPASASGPPPGSLAFVAFVAVVAAGALVVFAWIDRTIGVALELDFLHRDAIGWKKLRLLAGVALVAGAIGVEVLSVEVSPPGWELILAITLLGAPAAYMAGALAVGGSRVKDDTMRRYMKWMGLLVVSLILQLATTEIANLNFPLAIFAYFLYRASTSLLKTAPLRLATSVNPPPGPTETAMGQGSLPGAR